jgi:diguanylate cyclase (GGDEF)-like protein
VAHDITERKQTEAMQAAMYAISESAHTAKDLLALFQRIHQIIATLLAAENFSVGLYDAQRNELSFPYHVNERHATPGPLQLESAPLCAQVIREGQPLLLGPDSWPTRRQAVSTPADAPLYWLGVPLNTLNGPLGLLVLQSYSEGTRYTEKDRGLLQYVSTQVAAAIERKQMQDRLLHMAQYDPLTQLPNRQLFLDRLRTALARAQREQTLLSLLFLDLDHFKHVNDTLGHAIGDLLLQGVAQRLLECVRGTDTVARLGGDEFVLLLENGHAHDHTQVVTANILQAFGECFDLEGQCLHIRPSIGIASYPEHGSEEFHLLSHADEAMYLSKKNGGNQARVTTRSSARNG